MTCYTARSPAGPVIRTNRPLIAQQLHRWGYRVSRQAGESDGE